jgi:methionyl-tRNA formyltransferase
MKLAYFGFDPMASCLEALLAQTNHSVIAIFCPARDNKHSFNLRVTALAARAKLPVQFSPPTARHLEELRMQGCDCVVSAAYPYRIPVDPHMRGVNIHPSLLPQGRGPTPLPYLINEHPEAAGLTLHKLTKDFDAGDILAQIPVPLLANEDLEMLTARFQIAAPKFLLSCLDNLDRLWKKAVPQSGGSYWKRPTQDYRTIKWTESVIVIGRLVRAFGGKIGTNAIFDQKQWHVTAASSWEEKHSFAPGTVVHRSNNEVVVAAADGYVMLKQFFPI